MIIEMDGDSLEEARKKIQSRIQGGLHILSERIISDGKPATVRTSGCNEEEAIDKAGSQIPAGAQILNQKTLCNYESKTVNVEGFNEGEARLHAEIAVGENFKVGSVNLSAAGKKGFLGLGKKPNKYLAETVRQTIVETTYQSKPRISATIGKIFPVAVPEEASSPSSDSTRCNHCRRGLHVPGRPAYRCGKCMTYICNPCALNAWQKLKRPTRQNLPTCPTCGKDVRDGRIFA